MVKEMVREIVRRRVRRRMTGDGEGKVCVCALCSWVYARACVDSSRTREYHDGTSERSERSERSESRSVTLTCMMREKVSRKSRERFA